SAAFIVCLVLVLITGVSSPCQQTPPLDSPTIPNLPEVKPEILQLVVRDQWDRGNDMFGGKPRPASSPIDWKAVSERDELRHAAAQKLLAEGKVESAREYFFIALLFQHSGKPEELMLAHVLAVTAASKGYVHAKWMAAATMDRYLQSIKQPQVFGTQFIRDEKGNWTMEPYARESVSDALRAQWCVVPLAEQEKVLQAYRDGKEGMSTSVVDCK
ncbi:MAG: hypothetical protein ABSG51_10150, partial [Terracidiphilus sp.]